MPFLGGLGEAFLHEQDCDRHERKIKQPVLFHRDVLLLREG